MATATYDNFFLENEIEDNYNSHLDLQNFCTVDNNLQGTPGMLVKVNKYGAQGEAQDLAEGQGNDRFISTSLTGSEYRIKLAQVGYQYNDENAMTDPIAVATGTKHLGTALFNKINGDAFAEMQKTSNQHIGSTAVDFNSVVDTIALLDIADVNAGAEDFQRKQTETAFALLNEADLVGARKSMKDELHYVEAFAKVGYVGTVAGVNFYVKKDAPVGTVTIGHKAATTIFNKTGVEVENITAGNRGSEDANVRKNTLFARKYYVTALTNEGLMARLVLKGGTATATQEVAGTNSASQAIALDTNAIAAPSVYVKDELGVIVPLALGTGFTWSSADPDAVTITDAVPTTSKIIVSYKYTV